MTSSLRIDPQEIYLLERYTSLDYFGEMRDTWSMLVTHVENCLDSFMHNLLSNYRSRKVPEQPDVVWGELVLPNFRDTLKGLTDGFILLSHNDFRGFLWASGPLGDFRGQLEYWSGWMDEVQRAEYYRLLHESVRLSSNISTTAGARWLPTELSTRYDEESRGMLQQPNHWPIYRTNRSIYVASGGKVEKGGIYVADVNPSCAEFLSPELKQAPMVKVLVEVRDLIMPSNGKKYDEEVVVRDEPCLWYLVERAGDLDRHEVSGKPVGSDLNRTQGGQPCTETGYYFTPARRDSRRHFLRDELLPELSTEYGTTIWQWDPNQE